jgi:hypothetical protein
MERVRRSTCRWAGFAGLVFGAWWSYWAVRTLLAGFVVPPVFLVGAVPLVLGVLFVRRSFASAPDEMARVA